MTTETVQHTLAAVKARDLARTNALKRIESIMIPGAKALAGTRTPQSVGTMEHERDLTTTGPFRGRVVLIWRDMKASTIERHPRRPYDGDFSRPQYSAQIIVPEDITPEELVELARIAEIETHILMRESVATTTAQVYGYNAEAAAFDKVAAEYGIDFAAR